MENTKKHILVIDDDKRIRELLKQFLNKNNFFVTVSPDTKEARRELSKFIFDLMVVDLMLPHEMGVDFLTKIRKDGNRTPAIMLTAMGDIKNKTKCFENGCDDYLVKPFEPKELILRINNILNKNENIKNDFHEKDLLKKYIKTPKNLDKSKSEDKVIELFSRLLSLYYMKHFDNSEFPAFLFNIISSITQQKSHSITKNSLYLDLCKWYLYSGNNRNNAIPLMKQLSMEERSKMQMYIGEKNIIVLHPITDTKCRIAIRNAIANICLTFEKPVENNISNPNCIYVGQIIYINSNNKSITHTVQSGEYLGLIAEKYGVSVYDICALNDLTNPNLIYAGQVLKIK